VSTLQHNSANATNAVGQQTHTRHFSRRCPCCLCCVSKQRRAPAQLQYCTLFVIVRFDSSFLIDNNKISRRKRQNQGKNAQVSNTYVDDCAVRTITLCIWNCTVQYYPLGSPIWRCFQVFQNIAQCSLKNLKMVSLMFFKF